jgi:hypothetical protein
MRTRRGLCGVHVAEGIRKGTIVIQDQSPKVCSEPGCGGKARGHGLCSIHYKRMRNRQNLNFDATKSVVEREKLGLGYKTKAIAKSAEKRKASTFQVDQEKEIQRTDGLLEIKINSKTLSERAGIPLGTVSTLLNKLKDEGRIESFTYNRYTYLITLLIRPEFEILFSAGLNQKPPGVQDL